MRYVSRTPFGLALQGLRDEPARMRALGFDVRMHRTLAFTFAAFVASFAGLLSVWYNRRISPGSIDLGQTIDILIIAVIGGLYRLEGAWLGALVFVLINNYAQQIGFIGGRSDTLIGVVFLVIVLLSPNGLIGLWEKGVGAMRRRGPEAPATEERGSAEQLTPVQ
jgi:branched-chain amino acid transport system permease protein